MHQHRARILYRMQRIGRMLLRWIMLQEDGRQRPLRGRQQAFAVFGVMDMMLVQHAIELRLRHLVVRNFMNVPAPWQGAAAAGIAGRISSLVTI